MLFLSQKAAQFEDAGGVSGLDSVADGRSFASLDFDRDGFLDLVVVNANEPALQVFRNRIKRLPGREDVGRFIGVRLQGGNREATSSKEWSNRDGVGAKVLVHLGEVTLLRELHAGEGFAAQNSATLLIGVGARETVDALEVQWPSGKVQRAEGVPAGTLLTVHEDPSQAPGGGAFQREPYVRPSAAPPATTHQRLRLDLVEAGEKGSAKLRVFVAMSATCANCIRDLPRLRRVRGVLGESVAWYGVPVDDRPLEDWAVAHDPVPYELLRELGEAQRGVFTGLLRERLRQVGTPASVVTNRAGEVLHVQWGPPSVSRLRELLAAPARR